VLKREGLTPHIRISRLMFPHNVKPKAFLRIFVGQVWAMLEA
jgi:hypothetical protein